jgi:hypothetical protein
MKKLLSILALTIPLTGCSAPAKSLRPLISPEQAMAVPELSGVWGDDEAQAKAGTGTTWTFEEQKNHEYKLTVRDPEEDGVYVLRVRVARLGGTLFADAVFEEAALEGKRVDVDAFYVPIHYFGTMEIVEGEMHVRLLGEDWVKAALENGRCNVRHEQLENETILTAPTLELQEFAIQHGWDEEAFSYSVDLWRRRAAVK